MHINLIQGILGTTFAPIERNNLVSFGLSQDIFVRSKEVELSTEQSIENSYRKIEKQLGIINGQDVALMAERINQKFPQYSKDDIFYTMGVLSQYSSYKSWAHLGQEFEKYNIQGVATNPLIKKNKTKGIPVCLTDVMNYLAEKNLTKLLPKKVRPSESIILDDKFLRQLEKNPQLIEQLEENCVNFVYIENFEDGYNFLNQGDDFEKFVSNVLGKCKGDDIESELSGVLNGSNFQKIKELGLNPIIITNDVKTHPSEIADNLNPIIPLLEDFCSMLEKTSTEKNIQDRLNVLNDASIFVSPRMFCENLKNMHTKISERIEKEGIEEVFYAIPDIEKSFSLVNYIYQKVNNIDDESFINHNFNFRNTNLEEMLLYPDKFAVVVLDDVSGTGSSLIHGPFYYVDIPDIREQSGKDIRVIIAPMYSTKMAREMIQDFFNKTENNTFDHFVPMHMLPEYCNDMVNDILENPMVFYMGNDCLTSIVFPYMGPDTNDPRAFKIYEKMLYNPRAQKEL